MKAIVISEQKIEEILEDAREKLELTKFRKINEYPEELKFLAGEMHRAFNYHVCNMIERIRNE